MIIINSYTDSCTIPVGQLAGDWAGVDGYCDSTGQPTGDWVELSGGVFSVSSSAYQGTTCIRLVGNDYNSQIRTNQITWLPAGVVNTDVIEVTAKVYVESTLDAVGDIYMVLYDNVAGFGTPARATTIGAWHDLTASLTVQSNEGIRLYFYAYGEARFDKIKLVNNG